jgi:transportin-3
LVKVWSSGLKAQEVSTLLPYLPSTPACQVGEAYIFLISTAVKEVWTPVEAMLEVAAYPDFNIAAMSFNFWAKLAHKVGGCGRMVGWSVRGYGMPDAEAEEGSVFIPFPQTTGTAQESPPDFNHLDLEVLCL